jgi:hypothetical protein
MFVVRIETGNAAFDDDNLEAEVARILRELATFIADEYLPSAKALRDINGNRVGTAETVEGEAV